METNLPMYQLQRLLPQAELTLNLLRKSNTTPTVSAYAAIFRQFEYNRMPLGPLGCVVLIHKNPHARASWESHAVYRYYLYTSTDHYRSHACQVKKTKPK